MLNVNPDKLKFFAKLKALTFLKLPKSDKKLINKAITKMAVECMLRPRSALDTAARHAITASPDVILATLRKLPLEITTIDRLRVMREHVKHMVGYKLPTTETLEQMYNDLNVPTYPHMDLNHVPNAEQIRILITTGIAEEDPTFNVDNLLEDDEIHPSVNMAIETIQNMLVEYKDDTELHTALRKSLHRILCAGILRPNSQVPGYFFRNLRIKKRAELLKTAQGFVKFSNGQDEAKVMALHVSMSAGYITSKARTYSNSTLASVDYDVQDFIDNDYPLTSLTTIPTQAQLDWQVKYGFAQKIRSV